MIDDTFLKHQLRKEFALEIQALLETYDLAKEDESRHTEPVAGTTALVMKVDAEGNLVSLYIHQLKNRLKTATKELKRGAMRKRRLPRTRARVHASVSKKFSPRAATLCGRGK